MTTAEVLAKYPGLTLKEAEELHTGSTFKDLTQLVDELLQQHQEQANEQQPKQA